MRPFGRLLRGECLADLGREEEALGWFEGFGPVWGTEEILYQPYLYLRRAQLEEHLGQLDRARAHYEKFIEAWEGADPHLQHLVTLAREAVESLR
jgi:tetratricopeptide (TPR) repeat protein